MPTFFPTVLGAAFVAKRDELEAALPGWRRPGERRSWLDDASEAPAVPRDLPFDHVVLPPSERWEERYLALDLALAREPPFVGGSVYDALAERGLATEPIVAHGSFDDDPRFVWLVPARLCERLAAIASDALERELHEWNARSPEPNLKDELRELVDLARRGRSAGRDLYIWQVHAHHRGGAYGPRVRDWLEARRRG